MMFKSYSDIMAHLDKLGLFHMDFGLERMQAALKALNLNEPEFSVIQVVGTNGKGSTSTFLSAMARAHGIKTGLYTSPHFVSPRERIVCEGSPASEEDWLLPAQLIMQKAPNLTYFEFLTVLALLIFRAKGMRLVIMEAGLGGRFDATTAVAADLVCFTPISMDHESVLGTTLSAIARDKAEAMRANGVAVSAPQQPDARKALELVAASKKTHLEFCFNYAPLLARVAYENTPEGDGLPPNDCGLGLAGPHQAINAGLAVAAWRLFCKQNGIAAKDELIAEGASRAFIPGRLQLVKADPSGRHGYMLLDGAHNQAGMQALCTAIASSRIRPSVVIFSCLGDKDVAGMADILRAMVDNCSDYVEIIVPAIADNPRAAEPKDLASILRGRAVPDIGEALALAHNFASGPLSPHLICGSLYLLAEFYKMYPEYLDLGAKNQF